MSMSHRTKPKIDDAERLRLLRESVGLSQEGLAEQAGYSARQIARWEGGESRVREAVFQYHGPSNPSPGRPRTARLLSSTCSQASAARKGFEAAGGRCLYLSEWDKYSQATYKANFGDHDVHGDITKVDESEIPEHDIPCLPISCQPFSIAGVSKKNSLGRKHRFQCETQGTLFFDVERIIAEKRPRAFVLENVKNPASHDKGRTFAVIMPHPRREARL